MKTNYCQTSFKLFLKRSNKNLKFYNNNKKKKCIQDKAITKHRLKHKNCQKCTLCGKMLNSDITLQNHMASEHNKCVDSEDDNTGFVNSEEEITIDEQIAEILKMVAVCHCSTSGKKNFSCGFCLFYVIFVVQ